MKEKASGGGSCWSTSCLRSRAATGRVFGESLRLPGRSTCRTGWRLCRTTPVGSGRCAAWRGRSGKLGARRTSLRAVPEAAGGEGTRGGVAGESREVGGTAPLFRGASVGDRGELGKIFDEARDA